MSRLIALLLGGFGLGAYLRRRWRQLELERSPAEELRSKLAASRAADEAPTEPAPDLTEDLEARRRAVHDRARGAIDDLS